MLDKEKECTSCSGSGYYCGGKCGACNGTGLEYSKDDIIEALEAENERLQNTSSSHGYTKLPSLETLTVELEKTGWLHKGQFDLLEEHRRNGVDVVLSVIKRIGNFA